MFHNVYAFFGKGLSGSVELCAKKKIASAASKLPSIAPLT